MVFSIEHMFILKWLSMADSEESGKPNDFSLSHEKIVTIWFIPT